MTSIWAIPFALISALFITDVTTPPLATGKDIQPPEITLILPDEGQVFHNFAQLGGWVTDDTGIQFIGFTVDGVLIETPWEYDEEQLDLIAFGVWWWLTDEWENGPHDVGLIVWDFAGNFMTADVAVFFED